MNSTAAYGVRKTGLLSLPGETTSQSRAERERDRPAGDESSALAASRRRHAYMLTAATPTHTDAMQASLQASAASARRPASAAAYRPTGADSAGPYSVCSNRRQRATGQAD